MLRIEFLFLSSSTPAKGRKKHSGKRVASTSEPQDESTPAAEADTVTCGEDTPESTNTLPTIAATNFQIRV